MAQSFQEKDEEKPCVWVAESLSHKFVRLRGAIYLAESSVTPGFSQKCGCVQYVVCLLEVPV